MVEANALRTLKSQNIFRTERKLCFLIQKRYTTIAFETSLEEVAHEAAQ